MDIVKELSDRFNWEYYGGKHYESTYTKFVQTIYLPKKFKIDKRLIHYSAMVRSNLMSVYDAKLKLIDEPISSEEEKKLVKFVCKKLQLSVEDLNRIMSLEPKSYKDYKTYESIKNMLNIPITVMKKLHIWPKIA